MRKKLISGLLLAVTFVATSALVSCKDYAEDYYSELKGQSTEANTQITGLNTTLANLQTDLNNLRAGGATQEALEDSIANLKKKMETLNNCNCAADRQALHNDIANLEATKANLADMLAADALLQTAINNLAADLAKLATKEHNDSIDLAKAIDAANQAALNAATLAQQAKELAEGKADTAVVNALAKDVKDLEARVISLENRMTQVEKDAAEALAMATRDSIRLDVLETAMEGALTRLTNAEGAIQSLQADMEQAKKDIAQNAKDLAEAKQKYDNALKVINEALASLQRQINELSNGDYLTLKEVQDYLTPIVNGLQGQIDEVKNDLDDLKKKLNKYIEDVAGQIKNIIIQGTDSPVFGYFALPVGIQSNILAAYYGEPLATNAGGEVEFPTDRTALYVFSDEVISANAFNVIGGTGVITKKAYTYIMDEEEGNAGTLYLTINPAEKNFAGQQLKIVNSRDVESGITLSPIARSNKELTFGVTRPELIENGFYEAKATLDPTKIDQVKPNFSIEDLKPIAKDILNRNIDLTNIYFTVQGKLKDVLTRNGIKAEWEDTLGTHKIYSDYSIAATAIPALSYNFAAGINGKSIPTITPIGALNFDVDLNLSYSSTGIITNPLNEIYVMIDTDNDGTKEKYTVEGIDALNDLISQLNNAYADLNGDVNTLINQIESQVNNNMNDIENDLNSRFIDRINSIIGKVNKVINRINVYLENPNQLLQPFLAYESNGSYHHMSMSEAIPTEFKFGTGKAIELIPTSYTAEILAPAFQKFIAVTNVIAPDFSVSAQSGDATCQALADYANKTENFMNTVIPGKQTGIVFAPDPAHTEGYIYEITYAAVDYNGYNVAKKFYVRVK